MATAETLSAVDDVAVFAETELRSRLLPHQQEVAKSTAPIICVNGGRRSGKSHFAQVKALHVAATYRDARVLVVSPTIEKSRDFVRDLADLVRASKLSDSVVDDQSQLLTFGQGGEIRCVPATAGQIRGRGKNLRLAILDEAAFLSPDIWRDLRYALLDMRPEGSQALMICTPWGPPEHFFRETYFAGVEGDPDVCSAKWPTVLNTLISAEEIAKERARLAPAEAAAELDAEWQDSVGSLFSTQLLESCTADLDLPGFMELQGPARPFGGIDYGVVRDHSAAAVIYRLPVEWLNPGREVRPRFVVVPHVWRREHPLAGVVNDILRVPVPWAAVSSEQNGVGAGPTQQLRAGLLARPFPPMKGWKWNEHHTTAESKAEAFSALRLLFEHQAVVLPRHPDLLRQLRNLRYQQRMSGLSRIEADDDDTHDDICMALALAMAPYKPASRTRVRLALLARAESREKVLDARPPERLLEDVPIIETGGGLHVWQRPPLQSVTDYELTYPPVRVSLFHQFTKEVAAP
jgi:hypothetical protein